MNIVGLNAPLIFYKGEIDMKTLFHKFFNKKKEVVITKPVSDDEDAVVKTETFFPFFIYSKKNNEMIGEIMLTEEQARRINNILEEVDQSLQDIRFIRM